MVEKVLKDTLNNTLHLCVWNKVLEPKGVVQILHGVNEHGQRYAEFAEFLNGQGYIVYITDHFAQGQSRTETSGTYVDFTKKGHKILVDGLNQTKEMIKRDYPGLKIYALGHSMGALILRNYLLWNHNDYEKIIFIGAGLSSTKMMTILGRSLLPDTLSPLQAVTKMSKIVITTNPIPCVLLNLIV